MSINRLTTFTDLVTYLKENNVPHREDAANQVIEVPVTMAPLSGMLFMRWEKKFPYVQLIHPFVMGVPDERLHEVETAICRANSTNPLPGLGFEYNRKFVYMRLCVPVYEEGILATSFQKQVLGVLNLAKDFVGAFRDIVAGEPGSRVIELAIRHAKAGA